MTSSERLVDSAAQRITRHVGLAVALLVVVASCALFVMTIQAFQKDLEPDIHAASTQIAQSVTNTLDMAADLGIPAADLAGVEDFFVLTIENNSQIQSLQLKDPEGNVLASVGRGKDTPAAAKTARAALPESVESNQDSTVPENDRLSLILLSGAERLLGIFSSNAPVLEQPIMRGDQIYAVLSVEIAPDFINGQFRDILFDMVVILIVSLLVAFEIMTAFILFHIVTPIRRLIFLVVNGAHGKFDTYIDPKNNDEIGQITRRVSDVVISLHRRFVTLVASLSNAAPSVHNQLQTVSSRFSLSSAGPKRLFIGSFVDVRVPLFLFSFADELQKSWLPLYATSLAGSNSLISQEVLVGLPISVYMGTIAIVTPFASRWADDYGARLMFMIGLAPAIVGYMICAMAPDTLALVIGRGVTAFGYAIIIISCQGYIAAIATSENRGRAMAMFVGVLMSATMCGTAIGGVLADRVGYRTVFWISVGLSLAAGLLARSMLISELAADKTPKMSLIRGIAALMQNTRYTAMILLAAIPSKILLTGFLFYMVPLYLANLGSNEAEIGRVMLLYSLTIILLGSASGRIVDWLGRTGFMLAFGGVISAIGLIVFADWQNIWGVVLMVFIMGLGHSVTKSPQIAYALEIADEEAARIGRTTVLGVLRTTERIGSVLGPLFAAFLVVQFGFQMAIQIVGIGIVAASALFYIIIAREGASGAKPAVSG
ncbi:MFS transporter [Ciceribacter sp. L1K22]|uniref:MFS transporter n=1 Tax=Ciceribacter sp. L1K22 TaxID=2820275 RepID=UPI001ABE75F5|nr:MFS transporter [Ciceribacter sp. L1K22]MBO3761706.1 MFS transporter [Ciceribacter sp. L1K22]